MKTKRFIKLIFTSAIILSVLLSSAACSNAKSGGKFTIELYPEYAPQTVENFMKLVEEGFYDGLAFHRIVDEFMAQGGGYLPNSTTKKEAQTIFGEFANNNYEENTLKHTRGVISMARMSGMNDSASSEFFICFGDTPFLDGDYAAFGMVTEGMEVIDDLQNVERTLGFDGDISSPVEPVIIKKMTLLEVKDDGSNPKVEVEIEY